MVGGEGNGGVLYGLPWAEGTPHSSHIYLLGSELEYLVLREEGLGLTPRLPYSSPRGRLLPIVLLATTLLPLCLNSEWPKCESSSATTRGKSMMTGGCPGLRGRKEIIKHIRALSIFKVNQRRSGIIYRPGGEPVRGLLGGLWQAGTALALSEQKTAG